MPLIEAILVLGLGGYIGIMETKMEITIVGSIGVLNRVYIGVI